MNNIRHDYAVINRIFLEHTRELGDTLTAIAEDKSHVITGEQKCVYFAEQDPEVLKVLVRHAEAMQVPYKIYGRDFQAENIRYTCSGMLFDVLIGDNIYPDLQIPLLGEHQAKTVHWHWLCAWMSWRIFAGNPMLRIYFQIQCAIKFAANCLRSIIGADGDSKFGPFYPAGCVHPFRQL